MKAILKPSITKIRNDHGGHYTIFEAPELEYINPIEYYAASYKQTIVTNLRDMVLAKKLPLPIHEVDKAVEKLAEEEWSEKYDEIVSTSIPQDFIGLLTSKSKKQQVKLLKGQSLTPDQLYAFIFQAWSDYGYTFSQYKVEFDQKGLNKDDMPQVVEVIGNKVEKVGSTSLTDGQLRQAVKHRKVVISKFLDKGDSWHCLFVTYKSLRGDEKAWKGGQPHYHYISDKFGHDRHMVVQELTSDKYNLGSLPHVDIVEY